MSELLTAKDVEIKEFKKARFGGYAIPEVEDFLNQVADDLEAYAIQLDEKTARIAELEAHVKKQDEMTDAIKDALIQARQAAKEMEDKAQSERESIIAEAQAEAERIVAEAKETVQSSVSEAERKANDILAEAKLAASETVQISKDRRNRAEQTLAGMEQEIADRRKAAEDEAQEIIDKAHSEAKNILAAVQLEHSEYEKQIQFLSLKKQQFLKDTVAMLLDFGKIIEDAQGEEDSGPRPDNPAAEMFNQTEEPQIPLPVNDDPKTGRA